MSSFSLSNVRIAGIAASLPAQTVSNRDYDRISEKDRNLLIKTTGIEERRIAPASMTASDLCVAATEQLMQDLNWVPGDIQALIFVTQTPDYPVPATAMLLQDRLGLSKSCLAFDINQGCAGYVYGLATLSSLVASGGIKKALLLVGDTITHTISYEDKSSAPIFSDAGSATALEFVPDAPPMHFNLQSDGSGYKAIFIAEGGARTPVTAESLESVEIHPGICRAPNQLAMAGLDVFNFALREVVPNIKELLTFAGKTAEDPDYFIFHQANLLLNKSLQKKLKLPAEKVPLTLSKYGNTSCATIPITLVSELRNALTTQSLELAMSGFGVGLSWGSALIHTDKLVCSPLIELD